MKAEEIDRIICDCPYFQGKNTINRSAMGTHIGGCDLEFHYRKTCPSKECLCAERFGLAKMDGDSNTHNTDSTR